MDKDKMSQELSDKARELYQRLPNSAQTREPQDIYEFEHPEWNRFSFNLALDLRENSSSFIQDWRGHQLQTALGSYKEDELCPARHHSEFGASSEEINTSTWRNARGLLRVCWIETDIKSSSDSGKTGWMKWLRDKICCPNDTNSKSEQNNHVPDNHRWQLLLEHIRDSLKEINFYDKNGVLEWESISIEFPQNISIVVHCRSILLNGNNNYRDLFSKPIEDRAKFWAVLYPTIDTDAPDQSSIVHAYQALTFNQSTSIKSKQTQSIIPKSIEENGMLLRGVVGIEGAFFVAPIPSDVQLKNKLEIAGGESFWGGEVWIGWIITLFQRSACEKLASETAKELGPSIFDKHTKLDLISELEKYWKTVIELESKWIYREFSQSSDIEQLFASFQGVFDIEELWSDVREQTELISTYAEEKRAKGINKFQTLVGSIFATLVLFTSFLGMNVIEKKDLQENLKTSWQKGDSSIPNNIVESLLSLGSVNAISFVFGILILAVLFLILFAVALNSSSIMAKKIRLRTRILIRNWKILFIIALSITLGYIAYQYFTFLNGC